MRSRIIRNIIVITITVILVFVNAVSVYAVDYNVVKEDYLESKETYDTLTEQISSLETEIDELNSDIDANESKIESLKKEKENLEKTLESDDYESVLKAYNEAKTELDQSKSAYEKMEAKYETGAFGFYQWVADTYPEYKEDAELALKILSVGQDSGYLTDASDISGATSIPGMMSAVEFFRSYNGLEVFIGNNVVNTSFAATAECQVRVEYASSAYNHYSGDFVLNLSSENLAFGKENLSNYVFDNGRVNILDSPYTITAPTTSSEDDYNDWLEKELATGIGDAIDFGYGATAFSGLYFHEKYYYDKGEYFSDTSCIVGHYVNILSNNGSGTIMGAACSAEGAKAIGQTWFLRNDNLSISLEEYSSVLNAYYYDYLKRGEVIERYENAIANYNTIKESSDIITAITEKESEIASLQENVDTNTKTVNEKEKELSSLKEELEECSAKYEYLAAVYSQYNPGDTEIESAENTKNGIKITWSDIAYGATYNVYRRVSGETEWTCVGKTQDTSYEDTTVTNNKIYEYTIQAVTKNDGTYGNIVKSVPRLVMSTLSQTSYSDDVESSDGTQTVRYYAREVSWKAVTNADYYSVYIKNDNGVYEWQMDTTSLSVLIRSATHAAAYPNLTADIIVAESKTYDILVVPVANGSTTSLDRGKTKSLSIGQSYQTNYTATAVLTDSGVRITWGQQDFPVGAYFVVSRDCEETGDYGVELTKTAGYLYVDNDYDETQVYHYYVKAYDINGNELAFYDAGEVCTGTETVSLLSVNASMASLAEYDELSSGTSADYESAQNAYEAAKTDVNQAYADYVAAQTAYDQAEIASKHAQVNADEAGKKESEAKAAFNQAVEDKKADVNVQLDSANTNCSNVEKLYTEACEEYETIKSTIIDAAAEEYNSKISEYEKLLNSKISDVETEIQDLLEEQAELTMAYDNEVIEYDKAQAELTELNNQLAVLEEELENSKNAESIIANSDEYAAYSSALDEFNAVKAEYETAVTTKSDLDGQLAAAEDELAALNKKNSELESQISATNSQYAEAYEVLAAKHKECREYYDDHVVPIIEKYDASPSEYGEEYNSTLAAYNTKTKELMDMIDSMPSAKTLIAQQLETQDQIDDKQAEVDALTSKINVYSSIYAYIIGDYNEKKTNLDECENALNALKNGIRSVDEVNEDISAVNTRIAEINALTAPESGSTYEKLTSVIADYNSAVNHKALLNSYELDAALAGDIDSYYGTDADLAAIVKQIKTDKIIMQTSHGELLEQLESLQKESDNGKDLSGQIAELTDKKTIAENYEKQIETIKSEISDLNGSLDALDKINLSKLIEKASSEDNTYKDDLLNDEILIENFEQVYEYYQQLTAAENAENALAGAKSALEDAQSVYDNAYATFSTARANLNKYTDGHVKSTIVEGVDATCESAGYSQSEVCAECGEVLIESVEIPRLDHVYSEDIVTDAAAAPTCTETGLTEGSHCSICSKVITAQTVIPALGHDYQDVEGTYKAPTCTEAGKEADQKCSRCNSTVTGAIIKATGHTVVTDSAVDAACTKTGLTEGSHCEVCGKVITEQQIIPALGHKLTETKAVSATCEAAGNSAYWTCTTCKKYFSDAEGKTEVAKDSWITAALGHDKVQHEGKDATCTESGWDAYETCSRCDYTTYKEIPALGHKLTETKAVSATCEAAGNSAYWTCTTCKKCFSDAEGKTEIEKDSWVIPASGHNYVKGVCTYCRAVDADYVPKDGFALENGSYNYYKNDELMSGYTGIVKDNIDGTTAWYYVKNGVYTKATGLAQKADGSSSTWYYVKGGKYVKTATGLAQKADGSSKTWYYVLKGKYTKNTGIAKKADGSSSTWFYVKAGKYVTGVKTVCKKADGSSSTLYYVKNSKYTKATGTVTISGVKYKVTKGVAVKA